MILGIVKNQIPIFLHDRDAVKRKPDESLPDFCTRDKIYPGISIRGYDHFHVGIAAHLHLVEFHKLVVNGAQGDDPIGILDKLDDAKAFVELGTFAFEGFTFLKADLSDRSAMEELFKRGGFERVVNLAAQAKLFCVGNRAFFADDGYFDLSGILCL